MRRRRACRVSSRSSGSSSATINLGSASSEQNRRRMTIFKLKVSVASARTMARSALLLALLSGCSTSGADCDVSIRRATQSLWSAVDEDPPRLESVEQARSVLRDQLTLCPEISSVEPTPGVASEPFLLSRLDVAVLSADAHLVDIEMQRRLEGGAPASSTGQTFGMAARYSTPEIIQLLLLAGFDVESPDRFGNTALLSSIGGAQRDGENTRILLANGARPDAIAAFGWSALELAVSERDIGATRALLETASVAAGIGQLRYRILELANKSGNPAIIDQVNKARSEGRETSVDLR